MSSAPSKELGVRGSVIVVLASQLAGLFAMLGVPIVLTRTLSRGDFGLYQQFHLLLQTFLIFAVAGFPESLVYFIARKKAAVADFLLGAMVQLASATVVIGVVVLLAGPVLAGALADDAVANYLLPLFLGVVVLAVGDTLFVAQTALRRFRTFSFVFIFFAVLQASTVIVAAVTRGTLRAVIWAFVLGGAAKAAGALGWICWEVHRTRWSARPRMLRAQWAYALPYTGVQALKKINGQLHKYFVTASFSPEAYAIYDIGTKQVPALGLLRGSVVQVMTPHFAEMEEQKKHRAILGLWHASVSRLSLVYYPAAAALLAFAPELIALLFTPAYAGAAPIFRIYVLLMLADSLGGIEAMLKAFSENRFILWTTAIQLAIALIGSWVGLHWIGLPGPALAAVVAHVTGQSIRVLRVRRLIGVPLPEILPWKTLGSILALAVITGILARAGASLVASPGMRLGIGLPLFGACFLAAALRFDLIPVRERERLEAVVRWLAQRLPFREA